MTTRFLLVALTVFAVVCAFGIYRVDRVMERRLAQQERAEALMFARQVREMDRLTPPYHVAWEVRR
ncbi:MAG: hypothetical protein ACE5GY_10750 [Thermodesulfobacteriota bacterium]